MLVKMGIDSYCGKALHGPDGEPFGHPGGHGPPARWPDRERRNFLRLFASRTGSALVRLLHGQQLRESQRYPCRAAPAICRAWCIAAGTTPTRTADFISEGSLALTGRAPDDFVARRAVNYGVPHSPG